MSSMSSVLTPHSEHSMYRVSKSPCPRQDRHHCRHSRLGQRHNGHSQQRWHSLTAHASFTFPLLPTPTYPQPSPGERRQTVLILNGRCKS
ncbi:hypothetical protein E2C01_004641 [Portunus trituberculatus]|uniref:Uncharacterized protein n=1 Tax=Portunus trituberculatus TaxID=210409 RepID=A0A5B7CTI6_PORTR|nr:hypothetical protein [Portunus trituberculatus]